MTQLERRIYEVRRLTGITALIYELTYDGGFTVCWPGGRVRITESDRRYDAPVGDVDPRDVAAVVLRELARTPIPQPGQQGGP